MSKHKQKEYLPLFWCKSLRKQVKAFMKEEILPEDILNWHTNNTDKMLSEITAKCPDIKYALSNLMNRPDAYKITCEVFRDFDSYANVSMWEQNKQVFKFDKDFTNELIRTENLVLSKDVFKYLPYKSFYVDISDNRELCKEILGEGFFVTVRLDNEMWNVHLCKITDKLYFNDVLSFPNTDGICDVKETKNEVDIHEIVRKDGKNVMNFRTNAIDYKKYQVIVFQILTYLASTEPDVKESEETKYTYKRPDASAVPKNKFSEIQKWDVGVRFGSAYRKWKKEKQEAHSHNTENRQSETAKHVRPHTRKAHWQSYWYGKKGEERVRRPKWVAECYVNMSIADESNNPVVIHRCK